MSTRENVQIVKDSFVAEIWTDADRLFCVFGPVEAEPEQES